MGVQVRDNLLLGLCACLYFAGQVVLSEQSWASAAWKDGAWLLATGLLAWSNFGHAKRLPKSHNAVAWRVFGAAWVVTGFGLLFWTWYALVLRARPVFPAFSDFAFCATYPMVVVGAFFYGNDTPSRAETLKRLGDLGLLLCVVTTVLLFYFFGPTSAEPQSFGYRISASLQPIVGFTATLFLGLASLRSVNRTRRRVLALLMLALGLRTWGVCMYSRGLVFGAQPPLQEIEAAWILGYVCIANAIWLDRRSVSGPPVRCRYRHSGAMVTVTGVAGIGVMLLATASMWSPTQSTSLAIGLLGTGLSLGFRYVGSTQSEGKLTESLVALNATLEARVKERTEALELARDAALQASEAKSRFLANMSHELRTPLSGVLGYAELVEEDVASLNAPDTLRDVRRIQSSGEQLLELIDQLLDLARVESGANHVNLARVDLAAVFETLRMTVTPMMSMNRNELVITDETGGCVLHTDRGKLLQILLNLASNAAKFTTGGMVEIRASHVAERLTISVADTGVGMEPDDVVRVFEPFEQAGESQANREAGTGLGLSISRALAHLLGGTLTATSELGKGSVFTLTLPIIE